MKAYLKDRQAMFCELYEPGALKDLRFVVVFSRYEGKLLLSRHRKRATWETQGGHIEAGETPLEAARRELFEESGARGKALVPLCDYRVGNEEEPSNGTVFFAEVEELIPLPESEMAETALFDRLPEALSYPHITPVLFERAKSYFAAIEKPPAKHSAPCSDWR